MNETQRRAYLRAMGFQPVYPKFSSPWARPSPPYEFAVQPEPEAPVADPASHAGGVAPGETATAAARQQLAQSARRPSSPTPAPALAARPEYLTAAASPDREEAGLGAFSLRYYALTPELAVIDEWPVSGGSAHTASNQALLVNILRALDVWRDGMPLDSEAFDWPLAVNLPAAEADRAAPQALQGFIASRCSQDGFSNLLVFAGKIDSLLRADHENSPRDFPAPAGTYHLTVTHSLQSMLAYPELKRDVWMHLQALRIRLHS